MIVINQYELMFDCEKKLYTVKSKQAPICPRCGAIMSGYDSRRRNIIGFDGIPCELLLRRLKCPSCKALHLEIPDIIEPQKHYSSDVILAVRSGDTKTCPADDSSMRRWKKK